MVKNVPLEKLRLPFYAVATDIQSGQEIVFATGNAGEAVRASCSIPGVFRPTTFGGRTYDDGGVVSPIAVDAARARGADLIIAVDISSDLDQLQTPGDHRHDTPGGEHHVLENIHDTTAEGGRGHTAEGGKHGSSDFDKRNEAIMEGEKAATEAMPEDKGGDRKTAGQGRL